jgi:hypothetical protein
MNVELTQRQVRALRALIRREKVGRYSRIPLENGAYLSHKEIVELRSRLDHALDHAE